MALLGLLIVAGAVVFGIDLLAENRFNVPDPVIFGNHLGITGGRFYFVIGAMVGAGIILGLMLFIAGLRRRAAKAVSRHQERKAVRDVADERAALEAENAELRSHLEAERARTAPPTAGYVAREDAAHVHEGPVARAEDPALRHRHEGPIARHEDPAVRNEGPIARHQDR